MTTSLVSTNQTKVQKVCTLWTHDENFSRENVVFNKDKFPELQLSAGSLIQIVALAQAPVARDFQDGSKNISRDSSTTKVDEGSRDGHRAASSRRSRRGSMRIMLDENGVEIPGGRELDPEKSYIFVAKPMPAELKSRHPGLQISIAEKVAKVFGFRNRVQVVVTEADEESHSASHVEITFRDEYLARADMWRMSIAELSNRTVYRGQKLLFIGTIKATIKNVYINGKSTHSGYFSPTTKPIFRSESARYVLFIQMSKEMWDFDTEGAGEIMFNKVVNGFLPDLFKRWLKINARHLVTIILFTRMSYDGEPSTDRRNEKDNNDTEAPFDAFRDYYRVVVSDIASGDWINILYQLKKEFRAFLRDVSLIPRPKQRGDNDSGRANDPDLVIAGKPCTASQGNILEAINLASAQFAKDYIDRDLVRTGISVVVITAGTGVFEVDYNMLKLTTDTLIGSGIGIDLVCLSPMPLHSVPLFKYRKPRTMSDVKEDARRSEKRQNSVASFHEHDDRTPRQNHPNFGLMIRGSQASQESPPPILFDSTIVTPNDDADEWRYAMPHWLDISFWSGPSDEIVALTNHVKSTKTKTKSQKKNSAFALRCRMYELQMMGVMENELGGISIPYMEEASTYPHQLRDFLEDTSSSSVKPSKGKTSNVSPYSLKEKANADDHHEQSVRLHKAWMDAYDDQVFSSLTDKPSETDALSLHTPLNILEKKSGPSRLYRENYLSTSYRSMTPTVRRSARPSPEGSFSQLSREVSQELEPQSPRGTYYRSPDNKGQILPRADILYRQQLASKRSGDTLSYRGSLHSTPNDSPVVSRGNTPPPRSGFLPPPSSRPASVKPASTNKPWFLRQISFGGFGLGTSKATSSVGPVEAVEASATKGRMAKGTLISQKGPIAEKLASTRLPEPEKSDRSSEELSDSRSEDSRSDSRSEDSQSRPIAIKPKPRQKKIPSDELPSSQRSVETVRGPKLTTVSHSPRGGSLTKDPGSTFLFAGSQAVTKSIGPKLDLTSGGGTKVPRTLSPTSAIAPWAVLVNPCNPRKNNPNVFSQFRRWQHVFPKQLKTSSVKWKSLCSPAAVPLTNEYFPTAEQLATEYNESPYKIAQNDDDDVLEAPKSRESLVRELIAFRLSHGFQIIVGPAVAEVTGGREQDLSNILHSEYMCHDGDTVFMCVGNTIHQLVCAAGGEVEVKRFTRKPTTAMESSAGIDKPFPYKPFIRTAFEDKYESREVIFRPARKEYNWNFIDTFLAGYHDEFSEILRFWRARFVLIPVDIPHVHRRALPVLTEDSEEEIRLEGIRKLTQLWQRHRYIPPEERHFQATNAKKQKDPNPLAIEYHTHDPSTIVAAGPDNPLLNALENDFQSSLFSETDQYHTSNIDIKRLAEDLQGEKGIPMLDRRWHWRLHYNCFLGFDLTSWLLSNFRDIETRDEAVDLGNQLMEKGLFQHVQRRHQFRDGNFFFQIAAEYRAPRPDTKGGWFGMKKPERSVPSTPLTENPRSSPLMGRGSLKSRHSVDDSSRSSSIHEGEKTPTRDNTPKRKVVLSRVMRYDVDARKRSYRPELISLHYDRLHNPDNCYHIRIDWMNVTAKLIEDAIVTWATSVEKYGLKLVEVPIAEASNIIDHHPFRSPYVIKLALKPPQTQPDPQPLWDPSHFSPQQTKADRFAYHKALLRKQNFVLDMEAALAFPQDVEVSYSWGKPDYKYTQFIHRTGTVLAQITPEGDFLLLANRLAHNRAKDTTKFRPTDPYEHKRAATTTNTAPQTPALDKALAMKSPFASPLARPVQDSSLLHTALQATSLSQSQNPQQRPDFSSVMNQTPEQVKDELENFCSDPIRLKHFYEQALQQTPGASPRMPPVPESNIPSLGLPPAISIREASPATGAGWAGLGIGSIGTPRIETTSMMARRQGYEGMGTGSRTGSEGSSSVSTVVKRGSMESSASSLPTRRDSQGSVRSDTGGT